MRLIITKPTEYPGKGRIIIVDGEDYIITEYETGSEEQTRQVVRTIQNEARKTAESKGAEFKMKLGVYDA